MGHAGDTGGGVFSDRYCDGVAEAGDGGNRTGGDAVIHSQKEAGVATVEGINRRR
jgi:hypothetical protein